MCGILGYIGNIPEIYWPEAHTLLTNIFIKSKMRGTDASGFSTIHNADGSRLITDKRPIAANVFTARSNKFKSLRRYMPNIFIGHTRYSTSGSPEMNRNNHPFNSMRYSLVHNGGITRWEQIAKEINAGKRMRSLTDSELLLHLIDEKEDVDSGFQHMMDNIPSTSRVALGVIRHNPEQDKRLFLFRNTGSPLSILTIPQWKTIMFASTRWILKDALELTYGDFLENIIKDFGISEIEMPSWKLSEFGFDGDHPVAIDHFNIDEINPMGFTSTPIVVSSSSSTSVSNAQDDMDALYGKARAARIFASEVSTSTSDLTPASRLLPMNADASTSHDVSVGVSSDRSITEQMIKDCSDETKKSITSLTFTIDETIPILTAIRTEPFMQHIELDHFKKWMKRVF